MRNRISKESFAALCAQMTRKEIGDHLGITIWSVVYWEKKHGVKPKPGRKGRKAGPPIKVERDTAAPVVRHAHVDESTPYRLNWLVQGGLWLDLRHARQSA